MKDYIYILVGALFIIVFVQVYRYAATQNTNNNNNGNVPNLEPKQETNENGTTQKTISPQQLGEYLKGYKIGFFDMGNAFLNNWQGIDTHLRSKGIVTKALLIE